jgi:flagellar protein FliT
MTAVALYEHMSELSSKMVEAARDNDWNRLGALEFEIRKIRDELQVLEPAERPIGPLSEPERLRKVELIKRILADDREVRLHTEPWMDGVRRLLGGGARHRAMRAAYGAMRE